MLADGSAATPERAAAYVDAFNNIVLDTTNYGIAISAGHDCRFHDNMILSAATLPDGGKIAAQSNSGAYIWDVHHDANRNPPTSYNNRGDNNQIGWAIISPPIAPIGGCRTPQAGPAIAIGPAPLPARLRYRKESLAAKTDGCPPPPRPITTLDSQWRKPRVFRRSRK